jgi:hypothetical protein
VSPKPIEKLPKRPEWNNDFAGEKQEPEDHFDMNNGNFEEFTVDERESE